jgi:hypothetical protein
MIIDHDGASSCGFSVCYYYHIIISPLLPLASVPFFFHPLIYLYFELHHMRSFAKKRICQDIIFWSISLKIVAAILF